MLGKDIIKIFLASSFFSLFLSNACSRGTETDIKNTAGLTVKNSNDSGLGSGSSGDGNTGFGSKTDTSPAIISDGQNLYLTSLLETAPSSDPKLFSKSTDLKGTYRDDTQYILNLAVTSQDLEPDDGSPSTPSEDSNPATADSDFLDLTSNYVYGAFSIGECPDATLLTLKNLSSDLLVPYLMNVPSSSDPLVNLETQCALKRIPFDRNTTIVGLLNPLGIEKDALGQPKVEDQLLSFYFPLENVKNSQKILLLGTYYSPIPADSATTDDSDNTDDSGDTTDDATNIDTSTTGAANIDNATTTNSYNNIVVLYDLTAAKKLKNTTNNVNQSGLQLASTSPLKITYSYLAYEDLAEDILPWSSFCGDPTTANPTPDLTTCSLSLGTITNIDATQQEQNLSIINSDVCRNIALALILVQDPNDRSKLVYSFSNGAIARFAYCYGLLNNTTSPFSYPTPTPQDPTKTKDLYFFSNSVISIPYGFTADSFYTLSPTANLDKTSITDQLNTALTKAMLNLANAIVRGSNTQDASGKWQNSIIDLFKKQNFATLNLSLTNALPNQSENSVASSNDPYYFKVYLSLSSEHAIQTKNYHPPIPGSDPNASSSPVLKFNDIKFNDYSSLLFSFYDNKNKFLTTYKKNFLGSQTNFATQMKKISSSYANTSMTNLTFCDITPDLAKINSSVSGFSTFGFSTSSSTGTSVPLSVPATTDEIILTKFGQTFDLIKPDFATNSHYKISYYILKDSEGFYLSWPRKKKQAFSCAKSTEYDQTKSTHIPSLSDSMEKYGSILPSTPLTLKVPSSSAPATAANIQLFSSPDNATTRKGIETSTRVSVYNRAKQMLNNADHFIDSLNKTTNNFNFANHLFCYVEEDNTLDSTKNKIQLLGFIPLKEDLIPAAKDAGLWRTLNAEQGLDQAACLALFEAYVQVPLGNPLSTIPQNIYTQISSLHLKLAHLKTASQNAESSGQKAKDGLNKINKGFKKGKTAKTKNQKNAADTTKISITTGGNMGLSLTVGTDWFTANFAGKTPKVNIETVELNPFILESIGTIGTDTLTNTVTGIVTGTVTGIVTGTVTNTVTSTLTNTLTGATSMLTSTLTGTLTGTVTSTLTGTLTTGMTGTLTGTITDSTITGTVSDGTVTGTLTSTVTGGTITGTLTNMIAQTITGTVTGGTITGGPITGLAVPGGTITGGTITGLTAGTVTGTVTGMVTASSGSAAGAGAGSGSTGASASIARYPSLQLPISSSVITP